MTMTGWEYVLYGILVWGSLVAVALSSLLLLLLLVQGWRKLKRECRDH